MASASSGADAPRTCDAAATTDVVLAVAPFADITRPAIGVSLLKAAARRAGFSARVEYLNIDLAHVVGVDLYARIADDFPADLLVGEWFFASAVFGDDIPAEEDYVADVLSKLLPANAIEELLRARGALGAYLDSCADRILGASPSVVGFTTTFHQTCASLGVARRLKQVADPPVVVFGGANCEGEMGEQLLRSFECIDVVSCGEADESFSALLHHLLQGGPRPAMGVLTRDAPLGGSAAIRELDALPVPDYDDYFDRFTDLQLPSPRMLVLETARGCWWGARRHCTFCGLNGETMEFRSKSPERAYDEIVTSCERYSTSSISFVDNILDPAYVRTLFPRLAQSPLDFDFFFEVKANLHRDQLEALKAGGVRQIQPGIESLSDEVLRLMRKGVTAFQNVQLLRWSAELEISCSWNLICGFPGEPPAAYADMAALIPSLVHLPPPSSSARVRLDRFSPFHADPDGYGFARVRPARAYFYVFPFGRRDLQRLAYFFDYDYADDRDVDEYYAPVTEAVRGWWEEWRADSGPALLDATIDGDNVVVTDTRAVAVRAEHVMSGLPATVLALCDRTTTLTQLARSPFIDASRDDIASAVDTLVEDRLVARRGGQLVSLPLFRSRPADHPLLARNDRTDVQTTPVPALLRLGRSA